MSQPIVTLATILVGLTAALALLGSVRTATIPVREIDTSSCTDPACPICHGAGGHGDGWSKTND